MRINSSLDATPQNEKLGWMSPRPRIPFVARFSAQDRFAAASIGFLHNQSDMINSDAGENASFDPSSALFLAGLPNANTYSHLELRRVGMRDMACTSQTNLSCPGEIQSYPKQQIRLPET